MRWQLDGTKISLSYYLYKPDRDSMACLNVSHRSKPKEVGKNRVPWLNYLLSKVSLKRL